MALSRDSLLSSSGYLLLGVIFVAFSILNNLLFGGLRLDLTEQGLYTLSDGSREIIDEIKEPVHLHFFFSDKVTRNVPSLRSYSRQVRELLEEYASYGGDRLQLQVVDPEPFSQAEERASELGLQARPQEVGGDAIYFGLAAIDSVDRHQVIPFFESDREGVLEYEISRLLHKLLHPQKPVVGVLSSLDLTEGSLDQTGGQGEWVVLRQVRQSFRVRYLDPDSAILPERVDVLLAVRPSKLPPTALYVLDQHLMQGGKALVFADPVSGVGTSQGQDNQQVMAPGTPFWQLLGSWGVKIDPATVAADPANAMRVHTGGGPAQLHPAYFAVTEEGLSRDSVVTAQLETVRVGVPGALEALPSAVSRLQPLVRTGSSGGTLPGSLLGYRIASVDLRHYISEADESPILAALVSGPASSPFPASPSTATDIPEHVKSTESIGLILVADTDMLTDQYWVQVGNLFGQRFLQQAADNGNFVLNSLDYLGGSSALIDIRSRGRYSRPFTAVDEIRQEADERYRSRAEKLEERLRQTESELRRLNQESSKKDKQLLNTEKRAAKKRFEEERLRIRRELREVRHQLNRDIESLGIRLSIINIVAAPLLLVLVLLGIHRLLAYRLRRRRLS